MRFQLPDHAFPRLELSDSEQDRLIQEADRVIEDTIAANEAFLARRKQLPSRAWRHVRSKESLHIYRQRLDTSTIDSPELDDVASYSNGSVRDGDSPCSMKSSSHATWRETEVADFTGPQKSPDARRPDPVVPNFLRMASRGSPTSTTSGRWPSSDWWMESHKPSHVPAIVAVGHVEGALDDVLLGTIAHDDAAWRWKSSHINDRLDDARVLAVLRSPSAADPLRFAGVKWFTKEHPAALQHVVKRRDFVVLEAIGRTTDASGQPLGYFVVHSVELPRLPELSDLGILRGRLSICFVVRPSATVPNACDIFARGYSDPRGDMLEAVSVRLVADSLVAAVRVVDFAYIKKLRWLMMKQQDERQQTGGRLYASSQRAAATTCRTCRKSVRRLMNFLQGSGSMCHVCREPVCSRCTVTKRVTIDITRESVLQKPFTFCIHCVMQAKTIPARDVALAEVRQEQQPVVLLHQPEPEPDPRRNLMKRANSTASTQRETTRQPAVGGVVLFTGMDPVETSSKGKSVH
ncbi:hypothetical protein ATCC90586_007520 [Pythium insidiosum]|nr:hypothetical protein ATCC90586_007520 [Pythium insidiosum]